MLSLNHPIADLVGADYNPRRIDDGAVERLRQSIQEIGIVKPIIARGRTTVAGHQRTRALRSIGVTHAPVYLLGKDASTYDEVRFNQLHNGTDLDAGYEAVSIDTEVIGSEFGFIDVPPEAIHSEALSRGVNIRGEICRLIIAYGPWGACVATQDGEVIHAAQYALACRMLGKPCRTYVLQTSLKSKARGYLSSQYGVFSYDGIKRDSFVQTFAQMFRLRGGKRDNRSPTYEQLIKPWIAKNPTARVLDFGCGQGDYVKALRAQGYDMTGIEFFRRHGDAIDVDQVNRMVDAVLSKLRTGGRFDAVVLDYVLNSVDSQQAEEDVLNSIDALCRPGGVLFFSGRHSEHVAGLLRHKSAAYKKNLHRAVEFLDENGLTALYRKGSWFFQKFHSDEDIERIFRAHGWRKVSAFRTSVSFNVMVQKERDLVGRDVMLDALKREFDMTINRAGRTLGRSNDITNAIQPCLL